MPFQIVISLLQPMNVVYYFRRQSRAFRLQRIRLHNYFLDICVKEREASNLVQLFIVIVVIEVAVLKTHRSPNSFNLFYEVCATRSYLKKSCFLNLVKKNLWLFFSCYYFVQLSAIKRNTGELVYHARLFTNWSEWTKHIPNS